MNIGFNHKVFNSSIINQNKQVAFKGEFEDIIELSKTNNSPNSVDLEKRKFFGEKRYIHPTPERLKVIEQAAESSETKVVWKGLFRSIATAWKQILK